MNGAAFAPERWRRLEEIFHASLELPAGQREAFLLQSCGADHQLKAEIEGLLDADYRESPLIAGIVDDATARLLEDDSAAPEDA
jgi:hypothetical protein